MTILSSNTPPQTEGSNEKLQPKFGKGLQPKNKLSTLLESKKAFTPLGWHE